MDIAKLQVETRQPHGTREARRLRRGGKLPGIIYGHGQAPEHIVMGIRDLGTVLESKTHLVELRVNEATQQALIKEVQWDHLGIKPIHVDFSRVDLNERVTVSVPLEFRGTPIGVQEGGMLDHDRMEIELECLVTEIPASLRVNVANLKLGDSLHVRDVELPANAKAITPAEALVASVRAKVAETEVAPAGEGEAVVPEIIGRKEKEEAAAAEEEKKEKK
jgi:large subunit ribosomal protein L25